MEGFRAGKTDVSIDKLKSQGKVHQHAQSSERISAVAKEYAATRDRTVVLSEKQLDRAAITAQVRAELQQAGRLAPNKEVRTVLQEQRFRQEGRAADYKPGDVIQYGKGSPKHGLLPKTEATVEAVDSRRNLIVVRTGQDDLVTYSPSRLKTATNDSKVYRPEQQPISQGERIRITRNDKELNVRAGDFATVTRIDDRGSLKVRLDSGKEIELMPQAGSAHRTRLRRRKRPPRFSRTVHRDWGYPRNQEPEEHSCERPGRVHSHDGPGSSATEGTRTGEDAPAGTGSEAPATRGSAWLRYRSQPISVLLYLHTYTCRRSGAKCGRRRQHRRLPTDCVKGGTVSPFHALQSPFISTAGRKSLCDRPADGLRPNVANANQVEGLKGKLSLKRGFYAVRKALARLHAHWNRTYAVWVRSGTLARVGRFRSFCSWDCPSLARTHHGASRTLIRS